MERLLNDGWRFVKLPADSTLEDPQGAAWQQVDLPHDFLIAQEDNLYETCDGWYVRALDCPPEWANRVVLLRFDGVYMDCDVLLNGETICTHHYGYTAFDAELTGHLHPGENTVMVHIRHRSPNSRWYSGAGIYRDVTLHVLPAYHMPLDGTYVVQHLEENDTWQVEIHTELAGEGHGLLKHQLLDGAAVLAEETSPVAGDQSTAVLTITAPDRWSPARPRLYTLVTTLETPEGSQTIRQHLGFRTVEATTDRGLLINGSVTKLHGVCLHHDLGALGSAFHVKAMRRQLLAMRKMGVNALRTSHNPPARQVMDLCDELGILVVDEAFDMWRRAKTPYDYARFFDADVEADVAAWVRRDRNHPSLLMWSIGNEIVDTHADAEAPKLTARLRSLVRRHDPQRNGLVTIGSNYMPWAGAQNCAEELDVQGYNYGEKLYAQHHQAHPTWVIYGSETASTLSSRGVYRFPLSVSNLSDEDLQCSSLGNCITSWGTQDLCRMIVEDLNTPYSLGQFLWSGIDYIGEPTPYHTRSCYFGMMDTAVFPKDYWYLFQSLWTDEPMVHLGVTWDWNVGQCIDVPVMTSGAQAELFLNGRSLGKQQVDRTDWTRCRPVWRVPFEPGELRAVAYDAQGRVIAEDLRCTPRDSRRIILSAEDNALWADGEDMTFITISMADENGRPVDNAVDRVRVEVTGVGLLLGLDNGDSTDADGYKTNTRRLFNGKLLAMVGALETPGTVTVTVTSPGKEAASLTLSVRPAALTPGRVRRAALCPEHPMRAEIPVRRIQLVPLGDKRLTPEHPEVSFRFSCLPADADAQPVNFRVTNEKGITSPCAVCTVSGDIVTVRAKGDGQVYLRATCNNGADHPRIISQQELEITGLGQTNLNPYSFVSGGLYDLSYGDIGNGNDQGVSFAREGESMVGFSQVDFGPVGSDEVTLPIFELSSESFELTLWDGDPREGGQVLAVLPYHKPSRWNVYQPETYRLPRRLTGLHTLCFTMTKKIHLKGFSFTRQSRAWLPLSALEADIVYGDSFQRTAEGVLGIGNNVTLAYGDMDFGDATAAELTIDGATPLAENPVTIHYQNAAGEQAVALASFHGQGRGKQTFRVPVMPGVCEVSFVFLPGSQFDFYGFQFRPAAPCDRG